MRSQDRVRDRRLSRRARSERARLFSELRRSLLRAVACALRCALPARYIRTLHVPSSHHIRLLERAMRSGVVRTLVAVGAAAAVVVGVSSLRVRAATASADLTVSATVTTNCTINTGPLAFGNYDPVGTHASRPLDAAGRVTVACTKGTSPR